MTGQQFKEMMTKLNKIIKIMEKANGKQKNNC